MLFLFEPGFSTPVYADVRQFELDAGATRDIAEVDAGGRNVFIFCARNQAIRNTASDPSPYADLFWSVVYGGKPDQGEPICPWWARFQFQRGVMGTAPDFNMPFAMYEPGNNLYMRVSNESANTILVSAEFIGYTYRDEIQRHRHKEMGDSK